EDAAEHFAASIRANEKLAADNQGLRRDLSGSSAQLAALSADKDTLSRQNELLRSDLSASHGRIDALTAAKLQLETTLGELRRLWSALVDEKTALESQLGEALGRARVLSDDHNAAASDLRLARSQVGELIERNGMIDTERMELREKAEALERERARLTE